MKTETEIKNYIEALEKRKNIDIETPKMIDILSWILNNEGKIKCKQKKK